MWSLFSAVSLFMYRFLFVVVIINFLLTFVCLLSACLFLFFFLQNSFVLFESVKIAAILFGQCNPLRKYKKKNWWKLGFISDSSLRICVYMQVYVFYFVYFGWKCTFIQIYEQIWRLGTTGKQLVLEYVNDES